MIMLIFIFVNSKISKSRKKQKIATNPGRAVSPTFGCFTDLMKVFQDRNKGEETW